MSVYDRLSGILVEEFGVDADKLQPSATFEQLDLDSLDLVELAAVCEEQLGVRIEDEEAEELETLQQTADLLESKGATA